MFEQDIKRIRPNAIINKIETDFLKKIGDRRLICYGASGNWTDINKIIYIWDLVEFCVDGDSDKWGGDYYGKKIESPEKLRLIDKSRYAVVVLSIAYEEISLILDGMGLKENVHYYNICQYSSILNDQTIGPINSFLNFLGTVPTGICTRVVEYEKQKNRIGIVLAMEAFNFGITYVPYLVSLFLLLKWKGYNVKLIVENLHWDGDIIAYEGACDVYDEIRDLVISKLEKLIPLEDIMYIEPTEQNELSEDAKRECRRVADYSARWSKWYNASAVYCISKERLQKKYEEIYLKNLPYIEDFFEKNHFDTINAITALHKNSGLYYYVGKKHDMRVSSQDGMSGATLICANGPASYGEDIPIYLKRMWENMTNKDEIMNLAAQMWEKRRRASAKVSDMSMDEYYKERKEKGYENISFQAPQTELEQVYDVIIPLNLMCDGAALGIVTIFDDVKQWLEKTLEYVIYKLHSTVLIREHPAGKIQPLYMSNTELYIDYPEILEPYKGNKSLRYVKSDEEINLYQYIEHCKVLIPWTSTVGIEAGLMGKNVLVHTNVNYRGATFVLWVHTQEEYFENLKRSILEGEFLPGDKKQAYEDALVFFYYTMNRRLTTEFTIVNSCEAGWKFSSFEELLTAEGVDEIVQIVADNIPSVYLIEKQRRRLGQL